ncbi:MAG: DUF3570 domain-containing protein [Polyangiaceae bacterium]
MVRTSAHPRLVALFAALALMLCAAGAAAAGYDDNAASNAISSAMNDNYASANYAEAKKKFDEVLDKCSKKSARCSGSSRAQAYVGLGMVSSQLGKVDEAKANFTKALQEDPGAKLPSSGTSPNIRAQFADAQKAIPQPAPAPADAPAADEAPAPAAGGKIPGWNSPEAFALAGEALKAGLAGNFEECIEKDTASLKLEEQPGTRLHLTSCETKAGKLLSALTDAQKALKDGIAKRNGPVMDIAKKKVQDLLPRIPHVTFDPPAGVEDLKVVFDDREVKGDLHKKFSIDPGKHTVKAEGVQNGVPLGYEETFDVKEGDLLTVQLTLKSQAPEFLTQGQMQCMASAKSQEDVQKCLPENSKNLVIHAGTELAAYSDTNHVYVFSPSINGSILSPTSGWNVAGSFLVDFVTAASPDIVSEASSHYVEKRYAGSLSGGYKPGLYGVSAFANVSDEPDYLSLTAGGAVVADMHDKLITPRLAYSHSDDTIGRSDTPFSVFHNKLYTNGFDGSVSLVLSPTSVLVAGVSLTTERGDQSKPYRYIPMFTSAIASKVPAGVPVDVVNFYRLPFRPVEQLPTERDRYAFAIRFNHRFPNATLRLEERLYADSWLTKATSTDIRFIQDMGRYLRVWPHVRLHGQTAAGFYQLAYTAIIDSVGKIIVPTYRSDDRELGPLVTGTLGAGGRIALGKAEGNTSYGITVTGDLMYTRFFEALFVTTRTAVYGALGFDAEFQ